MGGQICPPIRDRAGWLHDNKAFQFCSLMEITLAITDLDLVANIKKNESDACLVDWWAVRGSFIFLLISLCHQSCSPFRNSIFLRPHPHHPRAWNSSTNSTAFQSLSFPGSFCFGPYSILHIVLQLVLSHLSSSYRSSYSSYQLPFHSDCLSQVWCFLLATL